MTQQQAPDLYSRVLDADRCVNDQAWTHHRDTLGHVGKCRRCAGLLRAGDSYRVGAVTWYRAECTAVGCGYETAAHGPRPQPRPKG